MILALVYPLVYFTVQAYIFDSLIVHSFLNAFTHPFTHLLTSPLNPLYPVIPLSTHAFTNSLVYIITLYISTFAYIKLWSQNVAAEFPLKLLAAGWIQIQNGHFLKCSLMKEIGAAYTTMA